MGSHRKGAIVISSSNSDDKGGIIDILNRPEKS